MRSSVAEAVANGLKMLQGILINNQFPGPQIEAVTNDNLIINVFNKLNEPFLLSWYRPVTPFPAPSPVFSSLHLPLIRIYHCCSFACCLFFWRGTCCC